MFNVVSSDWVFALRINAIQFLIFCSIVIFENILNILELESPIDLLFGFGVWFWLQFILALLF